MTDKDKAIDAYFEAWKSWSDNIHVQIFCCERIRALKGDVGGSAE